MRLDRNLNLNGKGKYALIKLRVLPPDVETEEEIYQSIIGVDKIEEVIDLGRVGSDSEFFVIRLKDKHARAALEAYAQSCIDDGDHEFGYEVREMAERAKRFPNSRHPD